MLAFTLGPPGRARLDGVEVARLAPSLVLGRTPLRPGFRGRVAQAIGRWRPDVVVAHSPVPFAAEMAFLAARRGRVPFVLTYHAGRLRGSSPFLHAMAVLDRATLERRVVSGASGLIAVSPFARDHALRRERDRVHVVPPGVDARFFAPGAAAPGRSVLFVGPLDRAYRWKGVDVLWAAFQRLRRRLPDARLVLVGDGDRAQDFRARARRCGLAGEVTFARRLPEAQLVRAYQGAAVVALPSLRDAEAFGMVLAEANACGRPVVASRVGGIPDFVRHGENGLLVEPGDAAGLADALELLLRDAALARRMGSLGRARVLAEHDWDDLAARTEDALGEALDGRSPRRIPATPARAGPWRLPGRGSEEVAPQP